jgi:lathosterol oxidase
MARSSLITVLSILALLLLGVTAAAHYEWEAATAATGGGSGSGSGGLVIGASFLLSKLAGWPAAAVDAGLPHAAASTRKPPAPATPAGPLPLRRPWPQHDDGLPALSFVRSINQPQQQQQQQQQQQHDQQRQRRLLANYNRWKNRVVLAPLLPAAARAALPHAVATWARNVVLGCLLYALPGAIWLASRWRKAAASAAAAAKPAAAWLSNADAVRAQIADSLRAIPLVALLPTLTEMAGEQGWTRAYLGAPRTLIGCAAAALVYQSLAEWAVYWVHRTMHASPWLYRNVHSVHHRHGRDSAALSPFAGMAFSWADGAAHAAPYSLLLLVVPMHWVVYEALVVISSWWTASTHDDEHAGVPGVLSARYHSLHHRVGRVNYGQYTQLFDWLHGTLSVPPELRGGGGSGGGGDDGSSKRIA